MIESAVLLWLSNKSAEQFSGDAPVVYVYGDAGYDEGGGSGGGVPWARWSWAIIGGAVLAFVFSVVSAYLSWSSNAVIEWPAGFRAFFALFAFLFPVSYIFGHVLFKLDMLRYIFRLKQRLLAQQVSGGQQLRQISRPA